MTKNMFRPLDSLQVMAYIIKQCKAKGIEPNATKLQKLMYCCYGVLLAVMDLRICDESPEAWQYGPVFPRTLMAFKRDGIDSVEALYLPTSTESIPEEARSLISQTLDFFGQYSATRLSNWSHLKGSPWSRASNDGEDLYGQIDDATIRSYFSEHVLKTGERAETGSFSRASA